MQLSAEIRWFWPTSSLQELKNWFVSETAHGLPCGGGGDRDDAYFLQDSAELGIKFRGKGKALDKTRGIEIKGLIGYSDELTLPSLAGTIQLWSKWVTHGIDVPEERFVKINKTRWVRKFNTASATLLEVATGRDEQPLAEPRILRAGCTVEYTELHIEKDKGWCTFGLEAFGSSSSLDQSLKSTASELTNRTLEIPGNGHCLSYPEWIQQYLKLGSKEGLKIPIPPRLV